MSHRGVQGFLVAAFAAAIGHLAWNSVVGPPPVPVYWVRSDGVALAGTNSETKYLYLRRQLYLPQQPRQAWLQVVGRDCLHVYVNGQLVGKSALDGFPVGVVLDLTPHLQVGRNVIAIAARQRSIGFPPVLAVAGAWRLSDGEHTLTADTDWRCSPIFERRAYWWFENEFDDRNWPPARLTSCSLQARVPLPPRAVTAERMGHWITPPHPMTGPCEVRRDFHVSGRPRDAWLRVTATASYLLTINGIVLDEQDAQLGTLHPATPMQRTYDLMPVVRRGHNSVSLRLTGTPGPPHLLADLEVRDDTGCGCRLGTDETWLARSEANGPGSIEAAQDGRSCHVDPGDLDIPPSRVPCSIVSLILPLDVLLRRVSGEIALMAVIALLMVIACRQAARFLAAGSGMPAPFPVAVVYLALVPATLAAGAGILACYDPRIACQDIYQEKWLYAVVFSVPLQWLLLAGIGRLRGRIGRWTEARRLVPGLAGCLVVVLMGGGLALRLHDLTAEPLHPDEVTILRISRFLMQRGFPNLEVHQDLPPIYISGCELESTSVALASFFFDDDRCTVRIPAVIYGVLMIPLLYRLGRSLFGTAAGLTAAAFYALAPSCLLMTHFGRYPSLLQLTTLLTVYYFWRTIAGAGPLRQRALWLTVLSFLAMFLSWEASILLAPGMVLAAVFYRRGRLRTLFCTPSIYAGAIVVLSVVLLQMAHGALQQTQFLWYGTGFSDVKLDLMWRYPFFDPLYYIRAASWSEDFLLPMLGLAGAGILAIRHRLQHRVRFLLLIFLTPCLLMSSLLTVFAARYSYHLIPLFILLASAALTAGARGMVRIVRAGPAPSYRGYARAIGLLVILIGIGLGSGMTVQLTELKSFLGSGARPGELRVPNFAGAVEQLRQHFQEGDVVVAAQPEVIDYLVASDGRGFPAGWSTDYWLQSTMLLQAVLDDHRSLPLHRFSGTAMISSRKGLESVFAHHRRIWYITAPPFDDKSNNAETAQFVREHMDIVYQDYASMMLLRDNQHRPAWKRLEGEDALQKAQAHYLH